MPHTIIAVPCTVRALEAALRSYCDHHGAWDAEVRVCLHKPQNFYTLELCAEAEMPSETKGETK